MKFKQLFFGLTATCLATSAFAANRPSGYVTLCNEGKTCSVASATNVAFGRADIFTYKVVSGSFVCSAATFGARTPGGVNECSVPSGTATSTASTASSKSASSKSTSSISSIIKSSVAATSSSVANTTLGFYPGCEMPTPTETVQFTATRIVAAGETFDGGNKRYNLSGGGQAEGQPAVFDVQDGGSIRNVIIGTLAADGIHCLGNCTLDHVWWEDTGEDAATALGPKGTIMSVNCGAAYKGADKTFQFNGRGELHVSNFYIGDAGKVARSCGDCTGNGGPRKIVLNNIIAHNVTTIVGINTNAGFDDVAVIRNLTINNSNTSKTKICQVYQGVVKGNGSSSALGVEFDTKNCDVRPSDVTLIGASQMNTSACAGSCPTN